MGAFNVRPTQQQLERKQHHEAENETLTTYRKPHMRS